ncbi:hypothetical protein [Streptomyces sp. TP-A0874]|uniref:hypothetical protein n=1 Tax=Streptomyces sp. TP-A0874 TaxID=549819 RepID=UPI0008535884|nr:hypothetical protein [Streptomyces sp. TP-A0874]
MRALALADAGEAADLAAFLERLIHYDRAAAVRLQAGDGVLAVFGRPASFEVLAVRTARLAGEPEHPGPSEGGAEPAPGGGRFDLTVSAGQLADAIDTALPDAVTEARPGRGLSLTLPAPVTGPPWTGLLPPRGGWQRADGLPEPAELRAAVSASVREFRMRTEALSAEQRTRSALDAIGREIWSRTLGTTDLPVRAVHAARSLGFLGRAAEREAVGAAGERGPEPLTLFTSGSWLRLRTPYGSVAVRRTGPPGLELTPA